jgi:hypothetical protein
MGESLWEVFSSAGESLSANTGSLPRILSPPLPNYVLWQPVVTQSVSTNQCTKAIASSVVRSPGDQHCNLA